MTRALAFGLALAGTFSASLALVAPALADDDEYVRKQDGRTCFWVKEINDFSVIDDEHVVLRGAGSRYYLATLFGTCLGIGYTESIALSSVTSTICENGGEHITFRDVTGPQSCLISQVERVADIKEARAIVAKRKEEAAEAKN